MLSTVSTALLWVLPQLIEASAFNTVCNITAFRPCRHHWGSSHLPPPFIQMKTHLSFRHFWVLRMWLSRNQYKKYIGKHKILILTMVNVTFDNRHQKTITTTEQSLSVYLVVSSWLKTFTLVAQEHQRSLLAGQPLKLTGLLKITSKAGNNCINAYLLGQPSLNLLIKHIYWLKQTDIISI